MSNQFKILRNQAFKDLFTGLVNLNEETVPDGKLWDN